MTIKSEIGSMINDQINMELYSANVYLTMASYFINQELNGFGNFFIVQMREEQFHAMKYFKFLHDVEGKFNLQSIAAPNQAYKNYKHVFELALENERKVTESTNNLIDAALANKDFGTYTFLEWFIKEQVEEEALMRNLLSKLELIGNDKSALFILDAELAKRSFSAPSDEA
jgi:ferritin